MDGCIENREREKKKREKKKKKKNTRPGPDRKDMNICRNGNKPHNFE